MRKVNSKATLQPNNSGNGSSIGMSPSTIKQHSMIKLYKVQTGAPNQQTKVNVNIQPSTLISKTIQARRMQNNNNTNQATIQNRTNHNITLMIGQVQDQNNNNNSVQTVKPSTIFSPGDAILRKNNDITQGASGLQQKSNNLQWDKQSPLSRQKLFANPDYNSVGPKTNDLYNNMRKQLEKQRSLQSLFNTTQKIQTQNTMKHQQSTIQLNPQQAKTSRNNIQQSNTLDSQRAVIRRGSKYQPNYTNGFIGGYHTQHNSIINNSNNILNNSQRSVTSNGMGTAGVNNSQQQSQNHMFMFKNNLSNMTRNKSAFINFNSTQPVQSQINKTQIDLGNEDKQSFQQVKKQMHNQSPSVSSDEEKKGSVEPPKLKDFNSNIQKTAIKLEVKRPLPNLGSHQKKRSQLPHGSFIETKMKNCLHSRNADTSANAYQTYQGTLNQKTILQKNQSQPNLYHQKNINLTQRTTFVKTSFLRHDDSRSVTPLNAASSKSPNGHSTRNDDKLSTKSKTKPIQGLKGDMKSLNLSPIVPQNLGKNKAQFQREPSHSDYQRTNLASASKRLEMRKQSVNSNGNYNNKPFSSLKKDRSAIDMNKHVSIKDEPTTEKKAGKKDIAANNAMKYQKPGYSSQETERGPGGTNSYSTADDFNLITNESLSKYILRFKNEGSQSRKMFQNDKSKQYQGQFTEGIGIQDESISIIKKQAPIFDKTQECKIKVNQILSNHNLSQNSNRYNININPDQIFIPLAPTQNKQQALPPVNKTPRALPYLHDETINYENQQRSNQNKIFIPLDDDQVTQKKSKFEDCKSESSLDDEEDLVDEKDFEEFDRVERSHEQSQNSMKVRVQIIDQDSIFRDVKGQSNQGACNNALNNYNQAANNLHHNTNGNIVHNYYYQKDDRNSLVNYDTSLLTHNTGRDNNSSPISEIREAKKTSEKAALNQQQQQQQTFRNQNNTKNANDIFSNYFPDSNSFLIPQASHQDQTIDMINTKTDDGYCDDQIFSQYHDDYSDSNTQMYKNIMIKLQKQEEEEIERVTQQTLISQKYKQIKNDKEKAKYLSVQLANIRSKYKQMLIEQVLAQQ